jgi:hypothetical protein
MKSDNSLTKSTQKYIELYKMITKNWNKRTVSVLLSEYLSCY